MFPKVDTAVFFLLKWYFIKAPKSPSIPTTFQRKFVAKNFQKSTNLVTLSTTNNKHLQGAH